ncbi:MAG: hypothetical protein WCB00_23345, partial [Candidatus Acidiferrales bacterium]
VGRRLVGLEFVAAVFRPAFDVLANRERCRNADVLERAPTRDLLFCPDRRQIEARIREYATPEIVRIPSHAQGGFSRNEQ